MAEYSDGSIVVNTEIDTEGFLKDSKKLNQAITSLSGQFTRIGQQMKTAIAKNNTAALETLNQKFAESQNQAEGLRNKLNAFSRVKILSSDYARTIAEIDKVDAKFQKLLDRQEKLDRLGISHKSAQWKSLQDDIDETSKRYEELNATRARMESDGTAYRLGEETAEYERLTRQFEDVTAGAEKLESRLNGAGRGSRVLYGALFIVRSALTGVGSMIRTAANGLLTISRRALSAARNLARVAGGAIISGFRKLGAAIGNAAGGLLSMFHHSKKANSGLQINLKTILKYGLGIRSLYMLFNRLRSAVTGAFGNMAKKIPEVNKTMSALASSLDRLKNSLGTAFQPILTVVAPYLKTFMDMLSNALTKVGMFFAALTGQQYVYRATAAQIDYADSLNRTANAAKKAENQLAKFDDLNILQDTSKNDSDSSTTPTSDFERVPIESSIAGFMARLKDLFKKGDFAEIGGIIADKINGVFNRLDTLISWENIGATITRIVTAITDGINGFVNRLDWEKIGRTFGSGINTLVNTLYLLFTRIDWEKIGAGLARGLNGLVHRVDWTKLGRLFGARFNILIDTIHGFVTNFKWGEAGTAFAEAVNGLVNEVKWTKLGETLAESVKGALTFLYNAVSKLEWGNTGIKFSNALNAFFAKKENWTLAGKTINTSIKGLLDFTKNLVITFDEKQFAEDVKALFAEVDWPGIARDTWSLIKTIFAKAGSFLDVLFGDESSEEAKKRADGSAYWSAYADKMNSKSLGTKIGEKLAAAINAGVKSLPADEIGDALDKALNGVLDFATSLVKNFDPDTFREKLETALGRVDWDAIARKVWLFVKDGLSALAKSVPIIGDFIHDIQIAGSAEDVSQALLTSLGEMYDSVAALSDLKGGGVGDRFYDGFKKSVLDGNGHVKEEFRGRMGEIFSESEIEAFERGDMNALEFFHGLGFGGVTAEGEATESLMSIIRGILGAPVAEAETAGTSVANQLFSSYILQTLLNQPDAENAVEGAFNQIWSGLDANGYGDIIAFDYFNSFMGAVMDESYHVKPEFKDVVESMFGSVETLEEGKVDAKDFLRGLVQGMWDSNGDTSVKLINIIDNILEKVRTDSDGLDEHSPSKRAAKYGEDFLKGFSGGVDGQEKDTTSAVKSAFTTITDIAFAMLAMNLAVSLGMAAVKKTFTTKLSEMETSTQTSFTNIKDKISTTLQNAGTVATQKMAQLANMMTQRVNGIQSTTTQGFQNIQNNIVNNLTGAMNRANSLNWSSVGSNIINGIARGLYNGWGWLQNTVWNLAISLYNTARAALGIHSPSKLFREGVGEMLGLGVAEGMEDSQPAILDTVSDVADAMAAEMNGTKMGADGSGLVKGLDGVLSTFSDKVSDSFSKLVDRLDAIAASVTFRTPAVADGSVLPYNVTGKSGGGADGLIGALEASNDEQTSAMIQMFNNQTTAIVRAMEQYCKTQINLDKRSLTDAIIEEINRRTRMTGESPLML